MSFVFEATLQKTKAEIALANAELARAKAELELANTKAKVDELKREAEQLKADIQEGGNGVSSAGDQDVNESTNLLSLKASIRELIQNYLNKLSVRTRL